MRALAPPPVPWKRTETLVPAPPVIPNASVSLAVLVDRNGREWPIEATFAAARVALAEKSRLRLAQRDGLIAFWEAKGYPEGCRIAEMPERHLDCGGAGR